MITNVTSLNLKKELSVNHDKAKLIICIFFLESADNTDKRKKRICRPIILVGRYIVRSLKETQQKRVLRLSRGEGREGGGESRVETEPFALTDAVIN